MKRATLVLSGALAVLLSAITSACGADSTSHTTAVQRGERYLEDPHAFSTSRFAYFTCVQCHAKTLATVGDHILPGAPLEGAASRPTFWGGRFDSLHDAVNECVTHFQRGDSIDPANPHVADLYAYLQSIGTTGQTQAVPFTVLTVTKDLPQGSASHGAEIYNRACRACHGDPNTGMGKLANAAVVPNDTQHFHGAEGPTVVREVVIEKIRTGSFLDFSGQMPPFSTELLSDTDVADVVTYLGLYPQQ